MGRAVGTGCRAANGWRTAAIRHGAHCAERGLSCTQVVSQFCAFRDSVMRRWAAENSRDGVADVADLIRFNRVVDRALAESIAGHNRGSDMDLHGTVKEVVSEITAAYPGCVVYAHCAGDLRGRWDSARLVQALRTSLATRYSTAIVDRPLT